jgi:hypothetical protein
MMFLCASPECNQAGIVFVVIPNQESDTDHAPMGRLFCVDHSVQDNDDSITKVEGD